VSLNSNIHSDLVDVVRTYAARAGGLARVRSLRDASAGFDRDAWPVIAELGLLGVLLPERIGGAGLTLAESAVIARELGRALLPIPLTATAVLAARILASGNATRCQAFVQRFVTGGLLPAVAWQERLGDIDVSNTTLFAEPTPTGMRLRGSKLCVVAGLAADGFIVSARPATGIALCWVPARTDGLSYTSQRRADGTEHGILQLESVEVPADHVLVEQPHGASVLAEALDHATVVASAELIGVAERALEITLEYLRTRVQFGKPIGSFQTLQHRAVDMFVQKELCVSALRAALDGVAGGDIGRRAVLASRVKARASAAALDICRKCIQMHGAIGFTDECDIGLYLKRALVLAAWLGNAAVHRSRYARLKRDDWVKGASERRSA
jgi:alkylation response protein AidB-like acyl-CoA dehydrogenase